MPSLNLPTPNKTPGDGAPADDINLVIEAVNTLNSAVANIPAGPQGPKGDTGAAGAAGVAATVTVASTVTTVRGGDAQVVRSGTPQNAQLAFYIPRGAQGPQGATGSQGAIGPTGPQGPIGPAGPAADISDTTPQGLGTAVPGTSQEASRSDHVHPIPTSGIAPSAITGTAVITTDSRLSDQRVPTDGSVTSAKIAAAGISPASVAGTAVITTDARLSNARTPTSHASTHGSAGSDPVTVAISQVTNLSQRLSVYQLTEPTSPQAGQIWMQA